MTHRLLLLLTWILAVAAPAAAADEPARSLYTSDQLVAEITKALQQHFKLSGELQVDLTRAWYTPEIAAQRWDFTLAEYPGVPAANMLLRIRLQADGRTVDNSSLMVHAALWRDAWYAREPIAAGTLFSATLLDARRIDVLREHDALPATEGDDSYIFSRQIGAERIVSWHDLARRPLVKRGAVVDVTASEGQLSVNMKALAMENGARGDLVLVRNLESRKEISAVVVGNNQVEVHF